MVVKIIIHINGAQKFIIFINKFIIHRNVSSKCIIHINGAQKCIIQIYHPQQLCSSCVSRELSLLPGALELKLAREESGWRFFPCDDSLSAWASDSFPSFASTGRSECAKWGFLRRRTPRSTGRKAISWSWACRSRRFSPKWTICRVWAWWRRRTRRLGNGSSIGKICCCWSSSSPPFFEQTNFVVAGKQGSWLRRCLWVEQKTQILWITLVVKKEMWDERCSFDGAWGISRIEIKEVHGKKMHLTAGSSELFVWFFWRSFSGLWRSNPITTLLTTLSHMQFFCEGDERSSLSVDWKSAWGMCFWGAWSRFSRPEALVPSHANIRVSGSVSLGISGIVKIEDFCSWTLDWP